MYFVHRVARKAKPPTLRVGGLAITRLFLTIPVLRLKRIESIRDHDDHIIKSLPDSVILKWSAPRTYDGHTFTDNGSIKTTI